MRRGKSVEIVVEGDHHYHHPQRTRGVLRTGGRSPPGETRHSHSRRRRKYQNSSIWKQSSSYWQSIHCQYWPGRFLLPAVHAEEAGGRMITSCCCFVWGLRRIQQVAVSCELWSDTMIWQVLNFWSLHVRLQSLLWAWYWLLDFKLYTAQSSHHFNWQKQSQQ